MDKYTDITINQDKVYMKVDGVETVYHAGRLKTLLNDLHRSFDAEYKETEELKKENEQLYELIDFANTLFVFKSSESCQAEWEKRLKELKE